MERKKRSIVWSISKHEFENLVKNSSTIGQILKYFGLSNKGGNSNTVKRRIKNENIDMSHISLGRGSNKGKILVCRKSDSEIFYKDGTNNRSFLKKRIIKNHLIPYICDSCGLGDFWNNKKLVLQLEHKNGISNDNRLENLCFLCPNCHTQTDTYSGKKNKKNKEYTYKPRFHLRKVERPCKEELEKLIKVLPFTHIGKKYGVSDNSVRKWVKNYGIKLKSKRGYQQKINSETRIRT